MSCHFHKVKDETFYVETGFVDLYYGDEVSLDSANVITLTPGMIFNIPPNLKHMLVGKANSRVFEFSTQHFDEDSYRIVKGD
jgi:hypothetical protein